MEKRYRAGQIYGYAICIVAVIVFLISVSTLVGTMFDLSDPLHARGFDYRQPTLASFETYKMEVLKSLPKDQPAPDDQTVRTMYEAAKTDRIQSVRLAAHRSLTINGLLIVICITLFTTHWIWVRRLARVEV